MDPRELTLLVTAAANWLFDRLPAEQLAVTAPGIVNTFCITVWVNIWHRSSWR